MGALSASGVAENFQILMYSVRSGLGIRNQARDHSGFSGPCLEKKRGGHSTHRHTNRKGNLKNTKWASKKPKHLLKRGFWKEKCDSANRRGEKKGCHKPG